MGVMPHPARRVLAAFLALVIVLGSGLLWIGVPIAGFWVAGQLFTDAVHFLLFVLGTVPLTMVLVGFALYRVNALYMSLRDQDEPGPSRSAWLVSDSDERRSVRLRRGGRQLIEVAMTVSIVMALVLMVIWFFFFAHQNLVTPP
jgi:hypothetical protein